MHRLVQGRQNSSGKGKTFLYHFGVDSPTQNHRRIAWYGNEQRGVCHGDELSYLFKNIYGDVPERHTIEFKSIERFVRNRFDFDIFFEVRHCFYFKVSVFTSFAQTGNPNSNVINADMENITWHEVNSQKPPFKCLNINEHLDFEDLPLSSRLSVWDEIYKKTNAPLY
jgi:carboxylesterase type B